MKYFEDFKVGETHHYSGKPMSSAEIMAFAHQWDPQRLHTDVDYATQLHGGLISSGFQTLLHVFEPVMREFMADVVNLGGLGFDKLRWPRPVRPNEPLDIKITVMGLTPSRSKPDRGVLAYTVEARNPAGEVVMTTETAAMLRRKGADGE